jgi:D-threo-aldose 1-dehydrogenase
MFSGSSPAGAKLPPVIFGTSGLGNLFVELDDDVKQAIIKECITFSQGVVIFDSAGKYGAGLALESLGKCLNALNVDPEKVIISNKLGWYRTELTTPEPTFEPGVWRNLKYDAIQKISYDGILECFEQGNELLNGFIPTMVSVHDPDEYIAKGATIVEKEQLFEDILEAYRALEYLKAQHKVSSVGVGAKDWKIIEKIAKHVKLDWVMIANSMTIKTHPDDLLDFMKGLEQDQVKIINSAVFHSGFLIGGDYYDYKYISHEDNENKALIKWRADFFALCEKYHIKPAEACVQFALKAPGVQSIALNTTNPRRVKENVYMALVKIPDGFWLELADKNIVSANFLNNILK